MQNEKFKLQNSKWKSFFVTFAFFTLHFAFCISRCPPPGLFTSGAFRGRHLFRKKIKEPIFSKSSNHPGACFLNLSKKPPSETRGRNRPTLGTSQHRAEKFCFHFFNFFLDKVNDYMFNCITICSCPQSRPKGMTRWSSIRSAREGSPIISLPRSRTLSSRESTARATSSLRKRS